MKRWRDEGSLLRDYAKFCECAKYTLARFHRMSLIDEHGVTYAMQNQNTNRLNRAHVDGTFQVKIKDEQIPGSSQG